MRRCDRSHGCGVRFFGGARLGVLCLMVMSLPVVVMGADAKATLDKLGMNRGVCVFLGLPDGGADQVVDVAKATELLIYVQSDSADEVAAIREAAAEAELLGVRIWADQGSPDQVQAASNLADAVFVGPSASKANVPRDELLRVLQPRASAFVGDDTITKPVPEGVDTWSHPYHSPDNNPNSTDRVATYPYLTQFLAEPMFGCISEVTVAAGGRMYKAFGHRAFKEVQNEVLNKLYCINGYNGTILWTRPLKEGFMIHRSTMVATEDTLYLADDESCKLIDGRTGEFLREIKPDPELAGGTVWKWMALRDGVLYALIGGEEVKAPTARASAGGFGGWPWGVWPGYEYGDPSKAFGFGRTLMAIDVESGEIRWRHQEKEHLDSRALVMRGNRMYAYCPGKFLLCLDTESGKPIWRNDSSETMEAIGDTGRAQGYIRGFATTAFMKCNDDHLFFAGPQRSALVAINATDGSFAWKYGDGNFQLVLRDDALYAFGKQGGESARLEYATGEVLNKFPGRRACTRATGSIDSMFCRARGGTIRYIPGSNAIEHISPMRPPCHDGVLISEGMLYWGPWICQCKLSLFGNIGLGPAGEFDFDAKPVEEEHLVQGEGDLTKVTGPGENVTMTFETGDDGIVRAVNKTNGELVWKASTGGPINFAPVVADNRVFVGSNDGRVYAFEAGTGRLLWRFQAAPEVRRIHVYGKLMSTWPVAGGVAVRDGTVYAAAGIAHYDGTHVYALDAVTGRIKWHNGNSGELNPEYKNGVSLCGQLSFAKQGDRDVLQFHGGNAVALGLYDLETGECVTPPPTTPQGSSRSTFYVDPILEKKQAK